MMVARSAAGSGGRWRWLALLAAALLPGVAAQAQNPPPPNMSFNELKFGVLVHDAHFLGGKEHGADLNPEIILASPVSNAWAASLPPYLSWAVQPRPTIGGEINTAGYTNQAYVGATWTWQLAGNVLRPGDGIALSYFFGPGFNDGQIAAKRPDRKALGSHVLFREALELGYFLTPAIQISAFIDHVSNGGLAKQNQSINDIGGRIGFRF
jgi:hypothetical protein